MTKLSSVFWDSFVCTCGKCVHHVSSLTQIFVQVHLLAALAFSLSLSLYIYILFSSLSAQCFVGNKTKKTTSIFIYVSLKLISSSLHFASLPLPEKKISPLRQQDKKNNLNLYLCLFEINLKYTSFPSLTLPEKKISPPQVTRPRSHYYKMWVQFTNLSLLTPQ